MKTRILPVLLLNLLLINTSFAADTSAKYRCLNSAGDGYNILHVTLPSDLNALNVGSSVSAQLKQNDNAGHFVKAEAQGKIQDSYQVGESDGTTLNNYLVRDVSNSENMESSVTNMRVGIRLGQIDSISLFMERNDGMRNGGYPAHTLYGRYQNCQVEQ